MSVDKVDWERLSDLKAAWQQACDTGPSSEATAAYQRYSREVTIAFPAIKAEREALVGPLNDTAVRAAIVALGQRETQTYRTQYGLRVGDPEDGFEELRSQYGDKGLSEWEDDVRTAVGAYLKALKEQSHDG
jgi:hypothetical protein